MSGLNRLDPMYIQNAKKEIENQNEMIERDISRIVDDVVSEIRFRNPQALITVRSRDINYLKRKCAERYGIDICRKAFIGVKSGSLFKEVQPTVSAFMDRCEGIKDSQEAENKTKKLIDSYGDDKDKDKK